MKLQVLLSAMHLKDHKYINTLNITTDCVVINQCDTNNIQILSDEGRNIKFISTTERGLSRSRNMAIDNSNADICILCDNDVEYLPDYEKIILDAHREYEKYDVIVFFVKKLMADSKPYFNEPKRMNWISCLKCSSPEISFKTKSIKGIRFAEKFGAGAKYAMGEENIFLYDCLKYGLKIIYLPIQIAALRYEESTWSKRDPEKYYFDRGAVFFRMSKLLFTFLILQFALRKRNLYQDYGIIRSIRRMCEGKRDFKNSL